MPSYKNQLLLSLLSLGGHHLSHEWSHNSNKQQQASLAATASTSCANSALSLVHSLHLQLPPLYNVHAFVANRLEYCSSLYAGLPACRLACLDRVLRSAARLIGGIPKFGHVSKYMLDVLYWLPAEQRISYRIASIVWRCLLGLAPLYLRELCCSLHSAMSSRSLRSSQQGLLLVPFARTSAKQSRAFSVVGPSIWNGLPSQLWTLPRALSPAFFLKLRLLFLAVLESGAPLSSSLEEALYKCSV